MQRADVDRYPPVLHQIRVLSEHARVTVVDRQPEHRQPLEVDAVNVRRVRVGRRRAPGPIGNLMEQIAFSRAIDRELDASSNVVIGYDPDAAAMLLRTTHGVPFLKRIVHLHELPDLSNAGRITRRSIRYLLEHLRRADLVVVPDTERARIVADAYSLDRMPLVVMNCPMTVTRIPESRLLPLLRDRGLADARIVHHQGSVGPDHYLDQVVLSMRHWPADAVFVIVGSGPNEFRARLISLAESIEVQRRLLFVERVPYDQVLSYAVGATLGITLLEPTIDNQRYCAGASNKRFEYAALGIAQLANDDPGMEQIFGATGIGALLSKIDADTIGEAVARLLCAPAMTAAMGEKARLAHLRANNYETQFAPVLRIIESWETNRA